MSWTDNDNKSAPQSGARKGIKRAAALSYEAGQDDAPIVVAVGQGKVAERMIETAREHDVPIVPDPSLAEILARMSIGDQIPEELYTAVAQVLVFVSELDSDWRERVRR